MNLGEWMLDFDDIILRRGQKYFEEGRVSQIVFEEDTWSADVEGSEDYEVSVTITGDESEPLAYSCTCPYSGAPYCKHTAALLYAIEAGAEKKTGKAKKLAQKGISLERLKRLPKEQLVQLLMEVCHAYPDAQDWIEARLAPKEDMLEHYRNLIRTSIRSCMRHGYVSYRDMFRAIKGADEALIYLQGQLVPAGDPLFALEFAHMLLQEVKELLDCGDDSDGGVGMTIECTLEAIGNLYALRIADAADAEQMAFFERMMLIVGSPLFRGWDHWNDELIDICICIADEQPSLRVRIMQLRENEMRRCEKESSSLGMNYSLEAAQKAYYALLCRWSEPKVAQQFLISHLENEKFRELLIEQYRDEGRYLEAIELCLSAEKVARETKYLGTERRWKELRYEILCQMNDQEAMTRLAQELLLDGDDAYYEKLKTLIPDGEWEGKRAELLDRIEQINAHLYKKLILRERDEARALAHVQAHREWIYDAYDLLAADYPDEVRRILVRQIQMEAASASMRSMYQDVCRHIVLLRKVDDGQTVDQLIEQFKLGYKRKSAFMDELGKIDGKKKRIQSGRQMNFMKNR